MADPAATDSPDAPKVPVDILGILSRIPHRFPFVMVDRIVGYEPKQWIECEKGVTIGEPYFKGHFPDEPLMPGVLQIEAAAQASALLVMLSEPDEDSLLVFGQVKRFTFIGPVRPGATLRIRAESRSMQGAQGLAEVQLSVDGEPVAKGTLAYGKMPRPKGL
jgi:3-hydroxyacyl-[acyl-carrier-protein] dehydratase